jgi:hypothetical protein
VIARKAFVGLCLLALLPQCGLGAAAKHEVREGIMSSFALPFGDLLAPMAEGTQISAVSLRFTLNYSLQEDDWQSGLDGQGSPSVAPTLQTTLRYTPLSYWFASVTGFYYVEPQQRQSWNPDFAYAFGYDDWHPYTLSLTYGNAGGNRFSPEPHGSRTRFEQGTWTLGFKFPLPQILEPVFTVGESDAVGCIAAFNYTPRFSDLTTRKLQSGKEVMTLGCRYSLPHWWYLNATVYAYPVSGQRQPWDPGITYGFGFFDWHQRTFSIQYNNFSRNGGWRGGSLGLSWSVNW